MTYALAPEISDRRMPAAPPGRTARHSVWTIVLHWGSALAIFVSLGSVLCRELVEDSTVRGVLMDIHRQFGLLILVTWSLRVTARLSSGMARHSGTTSALERIVANLVHLLLYALLLMMPILGLAVCNAHAVQVRLFGLFALPSLARPNLDLANTLSDFHAWGAWTLLGLVAAHALAACWHHWVRRDDVLRAMLPLARRPQATWASIRLLRSVGWQRRGSHCATN